MRLRFSPACLVVVVLLVLPFAAASIDARIAFDGSDVAKGGTRYIVIDADEAVTNISVRYMPEETYDNATSNYATFAHEYKLVGINTLHVHILDSTTGSVHDYYFAINVTAAPPNAPADPRFNECHAGPALCPGAFAPGAGLSFQDWFMTPAQIWDWIVWLFFFVLAAIIGWIVLIRTVS